MAQPISDALVAAIDAEMPRAASSGASLATILKDLYAKMARQEYRAGATQRTVDDDEAGHSGLSFKFKLFNSAVAAVSGYMADGTGLSAAEVAIADTAQALPDATTQYVECDNAGAISNKGGGFTADRLPLYEVITAGGAIQTVNDKRPFLMLLDSGSVKAGDLDDIVGANLLQATFTIAAQVSNYRDVTISLTPPDGVIISPNLPTKKHIEVWLADASGFWETATAPDGFAVQSDGTLISTLTAGKRLRIETGTSVWTVTMRVTNTGAGTWYMGVIIEDRVYWSNAIVIT